MDNVLVYLDDVLVFEETQEIHDSCLEEVFKRILVAGLSLNEKKCSFNQNKISFLGYEIFDGTIKPDK